ncbi:MAG: HD domain-containing protein [Lentisphaeria bacterium]
MTELKPHIPTKAICIPASEPIDVSEFLPLIDHSLFQRLRGRKQLGINHLVFPGAVHTRFEHALGVLGLTDRVCRMYDIAGADRRLLCAYALLHDIGHGPFSHQIEPILDGSHNEQGKLYIKDMGAELHKCRIDPDALLAMFEDEAPYKQIINDRNLGTDKLDYLRRDALHIGFTGTPEIEKVLRYSTPAEDGWKVEEKFIEDVKRIQKFYSYLHQHGYLNKTALSVQRVFQRAVQEALHHGVFSKDQLWRATDLELEAAMQSGQSALTYRLMKSLHDRSFHRSAFVIKPKKYGFVERRSGKALVVHEWNRQMLRKAATRLSDCQTSRAWENQLADRLGLEPGDILFAAMPFFDKLVPKDIRMFSACSGQSYWLFENDRDHYRSLQGDYLRTFAIRVITPRHNRRFVADSADIIADFLANKLTDD